MNSFQCLPSGSAAATHTLARRHLATVQLPLCITLKELGREVLYLTGADSSGTARSRRKS